MKLKVSTYRASLSQFLSGYSQGRLDNGLHFEVISDAFAKRLYKYAKPEFASISTNNWFEQATVLTG